MTEADESTSDRVTARRTFTNGSGGKVVTVSEFISPRRMSAVLRGWSEVGETIASCLVRELVEASQFDQNNKNADAEVEIAGGLGA